MGPAMALSWMLSLRRPVSWLMPRWERVPARPRHGRVMATTEPRTHLMPAQAPEQAVRLESFQERRKP
uniref:Uncharacterized protein n=1 Tax=Arundo donax TaxID=35708 RepID=A0A0A9EBC3_ARUDO